MGLDPITLIGAGLSVGSTVLQSYQAQQNHKAQAEAQAQQSAFQILQNQIEDQQTLDAARAQSIEAQQQKLRDRGFIIAAAASSETAGLSVDRQVSASAAQSEFAQDNIQRNAMNVAQQNIVENKAATASANNARKNQPRLNILQVGTSALQGGMFGYEAGTTLGLNKKG